MAIPNLLDTYHATKFIDQPLEMPVDKMWLTLGADAEK